MEYLMIGGGWAVYLAIHSLLAAGQVKRAVEGTSSVLYRYYRLVYSLLSVAGLLVLLYWMAVLPSERLFEPPGYLRYIAMILASWGVILVVSSFRYFSIPAFLGLKPERQSELIRMGVHQYIRHPIYSGTILIMIGMWLYTPTNLVLITALVIFAYLPFGIRFEEQKLINEFGADYLKYKEEVPGLIPGVW